MSSPTLRYGVRQVDTSVAIATPTLVPGTLGLNMTYLRVDPTPTAVQANTNGMFYRLGVNGDRIPLAIAKRYRFPEGFDGGVYVEVATGLATSFAVFTWASDDDITEII